MVRRLTGLLFVAAFAFTITTTTPSRASAQALSEPSVGTYVLLGLGGLALSGLVLWALWPSSSKKTAATPAPEAPDLALVPSDPAMSLAREVTASPSVTMPAVGITPIVGQGTGGLGLVVAW